MDTQPQAYRARWIFPVDSRPLRDGVLVVAAGRIIAVQPDWPQPAIDLGNVALIPGLVNCHTHLEFSELTTPLTPFQPFTDWIRAVIQYRQQRQQSDQQTAPGSVSQAIARGLEESLRGGVTLLGDIATTGWSWHDYLAPTQSPQTIVFQELLGLTAGRISEQTELMLWHLAEAPRTPALSAGLSPHAPYSTHPALLKLAIEHGQPPRVPVAIHLAETRAELELLREERGEFREFLNSLGIWPLGVFGGRSCRDWLEELTEHSRGLVIHGNYLSTDELAILARNPHVTLVYCPRTHAAFGHDRHPWQDLVALGGSVALGTDSRASNPDLSLWKELQFLAQQCPHLPHHSLLKLGTSWGARALGRAHDCGTLTPGKRADVVAIGLHAGAGTGENAFDPATGLLAPENWVQNVMLGGKWLDVATPPDLQ